MASRDATIRVSLRVGAFNSDVGKMESRIRSAGRRMGEALRAPMSAGLGAAKKSITGIANTLKGTIKTAATLGGAVAAGALIKDAVKLQSLYRNIEFSLSKIPGQLTSWQDIQKMVDNAVDRTGQNAEELANSFHEIFQATGDASYAEKAMESVGIAATATGEEIGNLTQASQLMKRKFGIAESGINDALAVFIQLTGSGGKSLDELTGRFAVMAGEARQAGMVGTTGLSQLLGMLLLLDESIGEKADPGLKNLFQTLKAGTTQLQRIQKEGRIKFEPEANALDKIKKILASTKARAAAEMTITADARTVFDELAKPFDLAMTEAKAKGFSNAAALDAALQAFDKNIKKASTTTMTWEDILKKQQGRLNTDPSIQLNRAIEKVKRAFAQPKMIAAIEKLADKLPVLADKLAEFVDWAVDNPWKAVGTAAGLKVGGSAVAGAAGAALPAIGKALFGAGGSAAAAGGASAAGSAAAGAGKAVATAGKAAASKAGLIWRGLGAAGTGTVAGLGKLGAGAAGASAGTGGAALLAAGGITAAAAAGAITGHVIRKQFLDPKVKKDFENMANAVDVTATSKAALSGNTDIETKQKALEEVRASIAKLQEGPSWWTTFAGFASEFSEDVKSPEMLRREQLEPLYKEEKKLEAAITTQWENQDKANKGLDDFTTAILKASRAIDKMSGNQPGSSRGPSKVSNPSTPGAEPRRG